jgi:hypothetical protein
MLLALAGCAVAPAGGPSSSPPWPYAAVADRSDPDLVNGRPRFTGRWIQADPDGDRVLMESSVRNIFLVSSFKTPKTLRYVDLGPGAEVENLAFDDSGNSVFLVGAVRSPHQQDAVFSRALLEVNLDRYQLMDTYTLSRDGESRGFALDTYKHRAYFLSDDGAGNGSVVAMDLYGGGRVARAQVGPVPWRVTRRGLVLNKNGDRILCLSGGESARSDFAPVDSTAGPSAPQLLFLEPDSLNVMSRVDLDPNFEPVALGYDATRDRAYVLEVGHNRSIVLIIEVPFADTRGRVPLPEETSDMDLQAGYAFLPGSKGIYIVDLDLENWISRPNLAFDLTGELAVAPDLSGAFVMFHAALHGGNPGVALVSLEDGSVLDVLQ